MHIHRKIYPQILAAAIGFASVAPCHAAVYTYDKLHRLTSVTYNSGQVIKYTYDKAGNIINVANTGSYSIEGYVYDKSANSLANVKLELNSLYDDIDIATEDNGYFKLSNLTKGNYTLTATGTDYYFAPTAIQLNVDNPKVKLTLTASQPPQLYFVIDDTQSMFEDITAVKEALIEYIKFLQDNIIAKGESPPLSALLTFKDKDEIIPRLTTDDYNAMLAEVKELKAVGGHDCPEDSVIALNQAADAIASGGTILFATDAPPHDGDDIDGLIANLRQQGLTIQILLSENDCIWKPKTIRRGSRNGDKSQNQDFFKAVEVYSRVVAEVGNGSTLTVFDKDSDTWLSNYRHRALNIMVSTVQPTIINVVPTNFPQGSTLDLEITASGSHFNSSSLNGVKIDGGIIVNSGSVLSPNRMIINIMVPNNTSLNRYDIVIDTILEGKRIENTYGIGVIEVTEATNEATILSIIPTQESRLQTNVKVLVHGLNTNFSQAKSQLSFADAGILVKSLIVHSRTFLEASLDITETARLGLHDVTVTTKAEIATENQIGPFLVLPYVEKPVAVPQQSLPAKPTVASPQPSRTPLCSNLGKTINLTCDNHGQTLADITITPTGAVAWGEIAGKVTNEGWVSGVTLLATATLTGGMLSGYVTNNGTIADVGFYGATLTGGKLAGKIKIYNNSNNLGILQDVMVLPETTVISATLVGKIDNQGTLTSVKIKPGTTVTGGTLLGVIQNNGMLQNVALAENTQIEGGSIAGKIQGKPNAIISKAKIFANAKLANVIIGQDCEIEEGVEIGTGVRFTANNSIPEGTDLSAALMTDGEIDFSTDVVTDAPNLLKHINALPDMQDNNWQLEQNDGRLEVMVDGTRMQVKPKRVKQAKRNRRAEIIIHDDGTVTVITAKGREILVEVQAPE